MPVLRVAITLLVGLALASCSAEPAASPPVRTPTTTFAPPAPIPLTNAEYQALLTAFDQALTPSMDAAAAAGSFEAVQAARVATLEALKPQISKLIDVVPPVAVTAAHRTFIAGISSAELALRSATMTIRPPATSNSCGVSLDIVPAAKNKVTDWSRAVAVKPLVDAGFQIGGFVKPAVAEPAESTADRRAANGKIIQRAGPRGRGRLEITNGAAADFAVSVVTSGDPKKPQVTVYVRAGGQATVTGISGTYQVFFKSGKDWDDGRRSFSRGCSYEKFEQSFDQSSNWRISLQKSVAGNARTDSVPPF